MDITDIKAWQWAILGVIVGVVLGFAWQGVDTRSGAPFTFREFYRDLGGVGATEKTRDMPLLRNIVIYPGEADPNGQVYQRVTLEQLNLDKTTQSPVYVAREFQASSTRDFNGSPSMEAWIDQIVKDRTGTWPGANQIAYRAPLTANPALYFGLWGAGGLVAIGVVWPMVIQLLLGAGLAQKAAPKPKAFKLSEYKAKGDIDDGVIRDAKKHTGITSEDQRKLDEVMAELERKTADMRTSDRVDEDAPAAPTPPPRILTLNAGPAAQEANPQPAAEQEQKSFGGEWYPVARPVHKKE
jgi:hypothetical protein